MLTRRTQILLDDDRYARLEQLAAATNRSIAAVIREAIDRVLPSGSMTKDQAVQHFRTEPSSDIGGPEDIRRALESMYPGEDEG